MNKKAIKITYWIVTILFSFFMLLDGIVGIIRIDDAKEIMIHLGYPIYVLTIIGIGKVLGTIGILQNKSNVLKEWAYAGFTINFLGAFASRILVGDGIGLIISPLIFLAVMFISYFLWKKLEKSNSKIF
jgi:Zn-dependent protease with chaperone function